MRFSFVKPLVVLLGLSGGVFAQGETSPAIVVELKFVGDRVEMVGKTEKDAFVPRQFDVPQMAPVFFEALASSDGEVVYSDEVHDPRNLRIDKAPPESGNQDQAPGGTERVEDSSTFITIPAGPTRPRELVVYRSQGRTTDGARTVLLRVGL